MNDQPVSQLYDRLSRYAMLTNLLKYGDRFASFTMHKSLNIPDEKRGEYTRHTQPLYLNDLALEAAGIEKDPRVLDAGCGFGGTIFRWHEKMGGKYAGYSLSSVQINAAKREAKRRGISADCEFFMKNYDEPIDDLFHIIICIEALIHSPDFKFTLSNLTSALEKGGRIIIVDDLRSNNSETMDKAQFELLRSSWHISSIPSLGEMLLACKEQQIKINQIIDLTSQVQIMPTVKIERAKNLLQCMHSILPFGGWRTFISAHLGGLALQELYREGVLRYILLVGQKD